jgi:hypothetical protein
MNAYGIKTSETKNYQKIIFSFLVTFSLIAAGCGTEFSTQKLKANSNNLEANGKASISVDGAKSDLNLTGLEPFHYQAEVTWPIGFENVTVYLDNALVFKSPSKEVNHCYIGLTHNTEAKIQVFTSSNNPNLDSQLEVTTTSVLLTSSKNSIKEDLTLISEWAIKTPLDINLSQLGNTFGLVTPMDLTAHRVFIDKEQPVITNGFDLKINTDELIVLKNGLPDTSAYEDLGVNNKNNDENAIIATFTEEGINQHTSYDLPGLPKTFWSEGKDGGNIVIKTKNAIGNINVFLRGQNGLNGSDGVPFIERAPSGPNGADGVSDWVDSPRIGHIVCQKHPTSGGPGLPGSNGRPGDNGKKGGNSGVLLLEISEKAPQFNLKVYKEIGKAGIAGKGGAGQLGGLGGNPGNSATRCSTASSGENGKDGEKGIDGVRESDGIFQNECISIGEGFGRCSN